MFAKVSCSPIVCSDEMAGPSWLAWGSKGAALTRRGMIASRIVNFILSLIDRVTE